MGTVQKHISEEVYRELRKGSFEEKIVQLKKVISEGLKDASGKEVFDEAEWHTPIATFEDTAVVVSSNGNFWHTRCRKVDGRLVLECATPMKVPVIDEESCTLFFDAQLEKAAGLFVEGKKEEAWGIVGGVVGLMAQFELTEERRSLMLQERCKKGNWRKIVRSKKETVEEIVGEAEKDEFSSFERFYNGEIKEEDLDKHALEVVEDTELVFGVLEGLLKESEELFYAFKIDSEVPKTEEKLILAKAVDEFTVDFFDDVGKMLKEARMLLKESDCIMCWARVHDGMVDMLGDARAASRLVNYFLTKLY